LKDTKSQKQNEKDTRGNKERVDIKDEKQDSGEVRIDRDDDDDDDDEGSLNIDELEKDINDDSLNIDPTVTKGLDVDSGSSNPVSDIDAQLEKELAEEMKKIREEGDVSEALKDTKSQKQNDKNISGNEEEADDEDNDDKDHHRDGLANESELDKASGSGNDEVNLLFKDLAEKTDQMEKVKKESGSTSKQSKKTQHESKQILNGSNLDDNNKQIEIEEDEISEYGDDVGHSLNVDDRDDKDEDMVVVENGTTAAAAAAAAVASKGGQSTTAADIIDDTVPTDDAVVEVDETEVKMEQVGIKPKPTQDKNTIIQDSSDTKEAPLEEKYANLDIDTSVDEDEYDSDGDNNAKKVSSNDIKSKVTNVEGDASKPMVGASLGEYDLSEIDNLLPSLEISQDGTSIADQMKRSSPKQSSISRKGGNSVTPLDSGTRNFTVHMGKEPVYENKNNNVGVGKAGSGGSNNDTRDHECSSSLYDYEAERENRPNIQDSQSYDDIDDVDDDDDDDYDDEYEDEEDNDGGRQQRSQSARGIRNSSRYTSSADNRDNDNSDYGPKSARFRPKSSSRRPKRSGRVSSSSYRHNKSNSSSKVSTPSSSSSNKIFRYWDPFNEDLPYVRRYLSEREKEAVDYLTREIDVDECYEFRHRMPEAPGHHSSNYRSQQLQQQSDMSKSISKSTFETLEKVQESFRKTPNISEKSRELMEGNRDWETRREKYIKDFIRKKKLIRKGLQPGDKGWKSGKKKGQQQHSRSKRQDSNDATSSMFYDRYDSRIKKWLATNRREKIKKLTQTEHMQRIKKAFSQTNKLLRKELSADEKKFLARNYFKFSKKINDEKENKGGSRKKSTHKKKIMLNRENYTFKPNLNTKEFEKRLGREIGNGGKFLERYEKDLQTREDKRWKEVEKVVLSSEAEAKLRALNQDMRKAKCQHKFEVCLRIQEEMALVIEEAQRLGRLAAEARKEQMVDERAKLGGAKARAADRLLLTLRSELEEAMENEDFELCIHLRERMKQIESGMPSKTKPFKRKKRQNKKLRTTDNKTRELMTSKGKSAPSNKNVSLSARRSVYKRMQDDVEKRKAKMEAINKSLLLPPDYAARRRKQRSTRRGRKMKNTKGKESPTVKKEEARKESVRKEMKAQKTEVDKADAKRKHAWENDVNGREKVGEDSHQPRRNSQSIEDTVKIGIEDRNTINTSQSRKNSQSSLSKEAKQLFSKRNQELHERSLLTENGMAETVHHSSDVEMGDGNISGLEDMHLDDLSEVDEDAIAAANITDVSDFEGLVLSD